MTTYRAHPKSRAAFVNRKVVQMTLIEHRLLGELQRFVPIGRDELEKRLWPEEELPNPNRLDVTMWKLRRRLPKGSIINVHGKGWLLSKRVRIVLDRRL